MAKKLLFKKSNASRSTSRIHNSILPARYLRLGSLYPIRNTFAIGFYAPLSFVNLCAQRPQVFYNVFIAPLDMLRLTDQGLALGAKASQN